jgi:tRNA-splicing ligase RtcB (3'-phosphate/5'-hydroxy nucleic acid ligase)
MDIITGKILKLNNWPDGKIIGLAKKVGAQLGELGFDRENVLTRLEAVRQNPGSFLADELTAELARECIRIGQKDLPSNDTHRETPLDYPIWGKENIDEGSIAQMDNAMRLPVSVAGALMPDAHVGYGLPIGGVLATENAVIPLRGRSRHCLSNEIVAIRSISSPARTKKGPVRAGTAKADRFRYGRTMEGQRPCRSSSSG